MKHNVKQIVFGLILCFPFLLQALQQEERGRFKIQRWFVELYSIQTACIVPSPIRRQKTSLLLLWCSYSELQTWKLYLRFCSCGLASAWESPPAELFWLTKLYFTGALSFLFSNIKRCNLVLSQYLSNTGMKLLKLTLFVKEKQRFDSALFMCVNFGLGIVSWNTYKPNFLCICWYLSFIFFFLHLSKSLEFISPFKFSPCCCHLCLLTFRLDYTLCSIQDYF